MITLGQVHRYLALIFHIVICLFPSNSAYVLLYHGNIQHLITHKLGRADRQATAPGLRAVCARLVGGRGENTLPYEVELPCRACLTA